MKKLYVTQNRVVLYLLQTKLQEIGIHSYMKNENAPLAGEIPSIVAWPELWIIDDEHYPAAQELVQKELSQIAKVTDDWICQHCHEQIEGQFVLCWKCGTSKEILN